MTPDLKELTRRLRETPPHVLKEREAAAAIDSLIAELEQCRKDAERYRALRDSSNQLHEDDISVSDSSFNVFFDEELDKEVDKLIDRAAIAKGQS